ncbi:MAG: hydrogen peroxide-inducible genes activator [Bacteroidota bacterium]
MTIQQLQYIIALDNHRHFVRAADSCHVTQPTLTLQIQKLEKEIGVLIFDRSAHPIKPTPVGEKFINKSRQIVREIEGLKDMVNADKYQLKGTFHIGVIPTLAPYLLPLFVKDFSEAHPDITLNIKEVQSEGIITGVTNGTLDIGIMATPLQEGQLREIPLYYEPFFVYIHPDHALFEKETLRPDDIKEKGLWLLDKGHCFRNQVLNICQHDHLLQSERIAFDTGSIETLKNLIQNYTGYTLVPELAVQHPADTPYIKRFEEPQPAREISLVVHNSFTKEQLLHNLRKSILAGVPHHFEKNKEFIRVKWR